MNMLNKVFHVNEPFLRSILLFVLIMVFHSLAVGIGSSLPFALLYGPALFYLHLNLQVEKRVKRVLIALTLPFIFLSICYFVYGINQMSIEGMSEHYYPVYFSLIILSLLFSSIVVLIQKHKWQIQANPMRSILVQQIAIISLVIALCTGMMLFDIFYALDFDIHPTFMIIMFMALALVLLSRYVYQEMTWAGQGKVESELSFEGLREESHTYSLPEELLEEYAERIHYCLFEKELYLRPDLSVNLLAQETNIPKHHFSELFNAYLGKSFYQLVAEYRIKNAISLIQERGHSITIEALAYESGFNSKTSFNKHFREITGCLPSEFRDRQLA